MECNFIKNPGKFLTILEKLSSVSGQKKKTFWGLLYSFSGAGPKYLEALRLE